MTKLTLRFEDMPERHAELAWRFGQPDECEVESEGAAGQASLWTLVSPLSSAASVAEHVRWASECLGPHEAFVRELVSLGGRVVMRLECRGEAEISFQINGRLLLPMAHAGVAIEFHAGSNAL